MATQPPPDYSSHVINGVYEVASHHVGKSLVDVIRNCFTGGKIRGGDYYLNRSRSLLHQHFASLPRKDQDVIYTQLAKTTTAKQRMRSSSGSIRERYSLAKDYKEVAKHLFIIVEAASERATDKTLMAQISEATMEEAPRLPPVGTTTTHTNPFSDSHEASSQADVDVGDLNQLEMTIFESEAAGEAAVVLGWQNRDGTTQEVASTFPRAASSGDGTGDASARSADLRLNRWLAETATLSSNAAFGSSEAGGNVGR